MRETHREIPPCPQDVLSLIPWYDDEALSFEERGRIEAHAAECGACRAEIRWTRGEDLAGAAEGAEPDRAWERVCARIARARIASGDAPGASSEGSPRNAAPSARTPRGVRSAAAWRRVVLAASLIAALAAGLVAGRQLGSADLPSFAAPLETAAEPKSCPAGVVCLEVIFRGDASAERITDAVRAIGGTLVAGPTRLGVYTVRLADDADGPAAAKVLRGEEEGVATFAEVVVP